ncbi:hypothetical protein [Streptomyces sp. SAI-229]|uniref:hypothetical protein n=1 Tax=Streptomyces sp. SAI-229 TaxID=3377731 RepID=UPI003C7A1640
MRVVEARMTTSRSRDSSELTEPAGPAGLPEPPSADCDVVTVPARQGLEAVDILRRAVGDAVGPVLHDDGCDTLGFLVPPGTAAAWDVPGSVCTETDGCGLTLPPEPSGAGADWLLPPEKVEPATDPEALREALDEAQRTIEAADGCA